MPTNKLWLEHTERAAWDTIHALREKLSKAENRLQSLVPGVARVPELLDQLESAKLKYAPQATSHAAVVTELLARIEQLQSEVANNQTSPAVIKVAVPMPRPLLDSDDFPDCHGDLLDDDLEALTRFARAMRRKAELAQPSGAQNMERLLQQAEDQLDEMSETEGVSLRDAAVELALLAARIYALSRGAD
jgi:hypothetical protein